MIVQSLLFVDRRIAKEKQSNHDIIRVGDIFSWHDGKA